MFFNILFGRTVIVEFTMYPVQYYMGSLPDGTPWPTEETHTGEYNRFMSQVSR